jgi:hypothetical protein
LTSDVHEAFEILRSKFAESIHLVHPDVTLPYSIDTDASNKAIGAVLKQTGRDNETLIVSTASRVLTPADISYSVAEKELLAIVYALEKFRVYIYGHSVTLNTDNKEL